MTNDRTMGRSALLALMTLALLGLGLGAPALAQPTYSIDVQGPTFGMPDGCTGVGIQGADILTNIAPGTPLPSPCTVGPFGLLGVFPTFMGFAELDAMSYGLEPNLPPGAAMAWFFSVDEFASGDPTGGPVSVTGAGAAGAMEASADVFRSFAVPPAAAVPPIPPGANAGIYDGDALPLAYGGVGLNLWEPNPPTFGLPDKGDNLDAVDIDQPPGTMPVFFSLDSAFADPFEGPPINTGTGPWNGVVGGDVLVSFGGGFGLYAPAALLGLDAVGGPDSDDLDALAIWDNGDGIYQPTTGPYSWANANTDMVLYSVRRGSAVIGTPDAIHGIPIEEGDVLVPVCGGGGGGCAPGVFIPAEILGLGTARSGTAGQYGPDDLDALDLGPC